MPFIQTNEIQTYYEEYGEGPPIVFLHGATADHRIWAEQMQPLADDYRLIVYDLCGHGQTGGSERASYSMELYTDDLDALIRSLELDRPVICGLSMGGMIAQRYAAKSPHAIAALCSLGARTPEILDGEWVERWLFPKLAEVLSPVISSEHVMGSLYRFYRWRDDEEGVGDLEKAERIQREHASNFPEITEEEVEKIHDVLRLYPSEPVDYSTITVPSLLMYGEYESEAAGSHAEFMTDRIPVAETRQIPDAGHNSHVDNPDFIIDSIREFLSIAVRDRYAPNQSHH